LGALIASGVPIIEGLTITRETSGNAMYEKVYSKVTDSIREGDTIANPMKANSFPAFHPVTAFFFLISVSLPPLSILFVKPDLWFFVLYGCAFMSLIGGAWYFLNYKKPVVEDLVVNMVAVGEETGELDTMLYKVADYYEEEVEQLTEGMMKMIEPLMIIFLGLVVLFIVASLFMPLIAIISGLTSNK
ncbi:MAG: type II secretion system F family protein, partial [Planctomycetaceae bacterium]|nr:type II secretion system F family protein [Planctomycetaceae bacterium]